MRAKIFFFFLGAARRARACPEVLPVVACAVFVTRAVRGAAFPCPCPGLRGGLLFCSIMNRLLKLCTYIADSIPHFFSFEHH